MLNIRALLVKYRRVLQVARKPSRDEFVTSAKISSIGIALIGVIGFVIFIAFVFAGI
ncbi:MAG: protein translocase SEC61 complex subunit gamma [Candidatus Aenigmarchaeota archaeon]|nr:protein translocase SEC61 complex subunit gamma [Candidatus Aenigmarchaeota archaeon]